MTQNVDYKAMAWYIKLLEKKAFLIKEFRRKNDFAEKYANQINENFLKEYGWTGMMINAVD